MILHAETCRFVRLGVKCLKRIGVTQKYIQNQITYRLSRKVSVYHFSYKSFRKELRN